MRAGIVQFDGLFEGAEIALLLAESKFEVLLQTDLHLSHEKEIHLIHLLQQIASPLKRTPLLEYSMLPKKQQQIGRRRLPQQQCTS